MTITYQYQHRIIVTAADGQQTAAEQLAAELRLDVCPTHTDPEIKTYDYALVVTADFLGLQSCNSPKFAPFYIDFLAGKMRYRSDEASLKKELLARALKAKPKDHPRIIDATAGLGRDSFILASLGFTVTALERSPIIYVLLRDALRRAAENADTAPAAARLQLIHADAGSWLATLEEEKRPDIIYLDPMFPSRDKSAAVKKEMVILQDLLGKDPNTDNLLALALACSKRRVVVKRPRLAPSLSGLAPSYTLAGKSSRFDIYMV
jgi:16S rRNA (guanine1516-N2)-methyltransferase